MPQKWTLGEWQVRRSWTLRLVCRCILRYQLWLALKCWWQLTLRPKDYNFYANFSKIPKLNNYSLRIVSYFQAGPSHQVKPIVWNTAMEVIARIISLSLRPDDRTYLKPDNDQIPKPNHTQIRRWIPFPRFCIFYSYYIHRMQYQFHRDEWTDKAESVHGSIADWYLERILDLVWISSCIREFADIT